MSSVAYADGHLYIHDENGDCVLVEATPEGYREKSRFTPPNPPKKKQAGQMEEKAFAYPVIANGKLYIRDLETLWAYDIKASRQAVTDEVRTKDGKRVEPQTIRKEKCSDENSCSILLTFLLLSYTKHEILLCLTNRRFLDGK